MEDPEPVLINPSPDSFIPLPANILPNKLAPNVPFCSLTSF